MFSNEERRVIEDAIKAGIDFETISKKYNVSGVTLEEWKRDMEIRHQAKILILHGMFEDAKAEMDKLQGEYNELVKMSLSAMIERMNGNRAGERELLNQMLEKDKDNVVAVGMLIKLTRETGDIDGYRRFLDMKLKQEPNNMKIIINRFLLAKKEGDIETQKKMLDLELSINPNSLKALYRKMGLARQESNLEDIEEIGNAILRINPSDRIATTAFTKYGIKANTNKPVRAAKSTRSTKLAYLKVEILENALKEMSDSSNESPIERARTLIYNEQDMMTTSGEIKEIIEGESDINKALILAELYFSAGLARKSTKIINGI